MEMTAEGFVENVGYVRNPDVVLREEDEDGGLLFNPDTNDVRVLNATALFLWRKSDGTRGRPELVDAIRGEFEDVPDDAVSNEVEKFLAEMVSGGFLGLRKG